MRLIDQMKVRREDPGDAVNRLLAAVGGHFRLNDDDRFKVKLVASELLNNIIYHSEASAIELRCYAGDGCLEIRIDDNGPGFSYDDFMNHDVTKGKDLWGQGGRGIFLVRNLAEEFTYNERGNSVRVVLDVQGREVPARP